MNEKIICPSCHKENEAGRSYCWVCYWPFKVEETGQNAAEPAKQKSRTPLEFTLKFLGVILLAVVGIPLALGALLLVTCFGMVALSSIR